jgi:RNA polymerase sigma-70 factor (ECF subfamily)
MFNPLAHERCPKDNINQPPSSSPDELLPDEQLISSALTGDRAAFNHLVIRHERRLYRFLAKSAHNPADIEDAMQQAVLKAYQNLKRYNPRWRYTTWLFTIALRELRSLQRTRRPTQHAEEFLEAAAPTIAHAIDQDPGDCWRTAQRLLPTQHYTALWLRHGEDLPVRDIAKIMSRPRIWVSVTIHRACATLRNALTPVANKAPAPQSSRLTQSIRGVL